MWPSFGFKLPALTYGSVPQLELFSRALGLRRAPLGASREMAKNSTSIQKERWKMLHGAQILY